MLYNFDWLFTNRLRLVIVSLIVSFFYLLLMPSFVFAQNNPTYLENQQPGTDAWKLDQPADDVTRQIKGYASATSINQGGSLTLHVTTNPAQSYAIEIYRMGWYGGFGGRLMQNVSSLNGTPQTVPQPNANTGLLALDWPSSYTLNIPANWTSGIYLAKLINAQGYDNYIVFAVRDDNRQADFLFQQSVTTYQAYNNFPHDDPKGKSLYTFNSNGANTVTGKSRAVKVSFNRPYAMGGSGDYFLWDHDLLLWMERAGYDVTYNTNIDTHVNGSNLSNHAVFLSTGHDEYWTKEMFDAVESTRDDGTHLVFIGANAAYSQIRLEDSAAGVANRVVVSYPDASLDPEPDTNRKTLLFRDIGRPEQLLRGVMFEDFNAGSNTDYVVRNDGHWAYNQSGFANGDRAVSIIGYEVDTYDNSIAKPANIGWYVLSASPFVTKGGATVTANTVLFRAPSGAWVFSTGTMAWSNGLNSYWEGDSRIQQMTANIFDRLAISSSAPQVTNPGNQSNDSDDNISLDIQATNPGGGTLTYSADDLPRGLSINANTGRISGQLELNRVRDELSSVTVSNGSESTSVYFTWQVNNPGAGSCRSGTQEAEWGRLFGNFVIVSDSNASGDGYIEVPAGANELTFNSTDRVEYCFTVAQTGDYRIKGWVKAPTAGRDSFYFTVDGAPADGYLWTAPQSNGFQTDYLNNGDGEDPVVVNLAAGEHTVTIYQRSEGISLDRLALELANPAPTPTFTPTPTPTFTPTPTPTFTPTPSQGLPLPGETVLKVPEGSTTDTTPLFRWVKATDATHYKVFVRNLDTDGAALAEVYALNELSCSTNTCAIEPPGTTFPNGNYRWNVRAENSTGVGPWSRNMAFTIENSNAPLSTPQLIAPLGSIPNAAPTFEWGSILAATDYTLIVYSVASNNIVFEQTYSAAETACDSGDGSSIGGSSCAIQPVGLLLSGGDYTWLVKGFNATSSSEWGIYVGQ